MDPAERGKLFTIEARPRAATVCETPMRPIWKGSISFGLVSIPVQVFNATSEREKISFKLLRRHDHSPIRYKRVAEADGKEVPWGEIVKGYEYEKEKFVVLEEADFDQVDLKTTESIEILDFVEESEVPPIYFEKPYYLEPTKGGDGPYGVLRAALAETGKIGIAKVVLRSRQHLAAVRAEGEALMLETMRFADEISPAAGLRVPAAGAVDTRVMGMAKMLIEQMSQPWEPERYVDEYSDKLRELIDGKIKAGGKALPAKKKAAATAGNVIDLAAMLEASLGEAVGKGRGAQPAKSRLKQRAPAPRARKGGARSKPRAAHKTAA